MILTETNFLQTAAGTTKPGIMVAAYPGSDTNVRGTQQLFLGKHNIVSSDVISMGGHKSTGQILFRTGLTGGLFLNGFTLTKVGFGKNSLVDSVITNAGSIVVSNGLLGVTRSIIDGPGAITVVGTNILQLENYSTGYIAKPLIFGGGGLHTSGDRQWLHPLLADHQCRRHDH
jgi:hypothetical protein